MVNVPLRLFSGVMKALVLLPGSNRNNRKLPPSK